MRVSAPIYKRLIVILLFPASLIAQQQSQSKLSFGSKNYAFYRHEFDAGIGLINYIGDIGGRNNANSNIFNSTISQLKNIYTIGYRYNLSKKIAFKGSYSHGKLGGDDKLSQNEKRNYRNLAFETYINEFAILGEYYFSRADYGHGYYKRGVVGRRGRFCSSNFHIGLGIFKFNPTYNGIALQRLNTEGQGLENAKNPYKLIALAIPVGYNISFQIKKKYKLGLELNYRFTSTDFLDDVSGYYYDKELIRNAYGDLAAELSNRTIGSKDWAGTGSPRGNPKNRDSYLSAVVVLTYMPFKRRVSVKKKSRWTKF